MNCFQDTMAAYIEARLMLDADTNDSDEVGPIFCRAENAVMHCPVATWDQLRDKLEVVLGDNQSCIDDSVHASVLADLRRLTDNRPTRVFSAKEWLQRFESHGGGWLVHDGKPSLVICETGHVADIIAELEMSGRREDVMAHILERYAAKEMQPAE